MVQAEERIGAAFKEGTVEADGFQIRYLEAGDGAPVIMLHGAGRLSLSKVHDLLAKQYRVIAPELPGFGDSPVNERTQSMHDMAGTVIKFATALGLDSYSIYTAAFTARIGLWAAIDDADRVEALVLVSPSAILPEDWSGPNGTPEENARRMYAHPEKQPAHAPEDPAVAAKQRTLVARIRGPHRDPELESRFPDVQVPTLVVFGTKDGINPPEMGRIYREKLPNCNLVFVYDAAHSIASERPEALAGVAADFLERHETFIVSRANTMINP